MWGGSSVLLPCPCPHPTPGERHDFPRVEFLELPDSQRLNSRAKIKQDHPRCWTSLPCSSGYCEANSCPHKVASCAQRATEGAEHTGSLSLGQSGSCGSPEAPLTSVPSYSSPDSRPIPGPREAPQQHPNSTQVPCCPQHLLSGT